MNNSQYRGAFIAPLKDEPSDMAPTGATFNSPTVVIGEPPFQREITLQTNNVNTFQLFMWRCRNAFAIPASIGAILADTLIYVGASGLVTQLYGIFYTGGAYLPAIGMLAFVFVLYMAVWTTVLKFCPELMGAFWWRLVLILMGAILCIV